VSARTGFDYDTVLDLEHIQAAAAHAAEALDATTVALVELSPEGTSRYQVVVVDRSVPMWRRGEPAAADRWMVVLVGWIGRANPWDGLPVRATYAADMWTSLAPGEGGRQHASEVLTRFLNALAPLLQAAETGPA